MKKLPAYYNQNLINTDFRKHPELYQIGWGEQGVLMAKPYISELLLMWRFRTPDVALKSARAIFKKFLEYKKQKILLAWTWLVNSCK